MVYEARYLARNCELKTRLGDIVSHLRHLSHLSQDKTKLLFSFFLILFNYAIQGKFITWLVNSELNCTWKPISHSSLRDSCDIGFRVQFNAEFPRQVMNFPIIYNVRSYKPIAILRRQYHIILTASWEKIYSVLGGVAKRRSPIRNIFSPNAVNIMWYCRLKIAISFVSRSIIYKDKWNCKLINPRLIEISILSTCET